MSICDLGALSDGRRVQAVRFGAPEGVQAEVLTFGATLRSLTVPTPRGRVEVLLQLPALADYEADARFLNPVIGRCANRIGGAAFSIDGQVFPVTANEGANCLHGGAPGWHKRLWTLKAANETHCTLDYTSPHGESGFPGEVRAEVAFTLPDPDTLQIAWCARTDAPTPVNLTHHLYFALAGAPGATILDDRLAIAGDATTPVRPDLIPTGALQPVNGTAYDLHSPRRLGDLLAHPDAAMTRAGGLDLNWVLSGSAPAATVASPQSGVTLQITTDQPGLQVYSGQGLAAPFIRHQALVLEPQGLPDAVNHKEFPSVILHPGDLYERRALYRFTAS